MDARRFDVIVIGGGHAGCEAAAAAARVGAATLLITQKRATIGAMSCNPAIGGLAKGTLVREVDALDGLMGRVADAAGIQFRVLNRSKGPAVRGPRAQQDRALYRAAMQAALGSQPNLTIREGTVEDLALDARASDRPRVSGVVLGDGTPIPAPRVVLTHRHLPARPHPYRRAPDPGGPRGRCAGDRPRAHPGTVGLPPGPAEDGHAAPAGRAHHRLGRAGGAGGRRAARALLLPHRCHRQAAGALPHHRHGAGGPRPDSPQPRALAHLFGRDRKPRPPLLPFHRGQGGALRRPRLPPGFPGTGGPRRPHDLSQRHLDRAARRRAAGAGGDDSGAGAGGRAASPATPSSTTMWTRAS